jgi:hypothetical protein
VLRSTPGITSFSETQKCKWSLLQWLLQKATMVYKQRHNLKEVSAPEVGRRRKLPWHWCRSRPTFLHHPKCGRIKLPSHSSGSLSEAITHRSAEDSRFSVYFRQIVMNEKLTVRVSGLGGKFQQLACIALREAKWLTVVRFSSARQASLAVP